MAKWMSYIYERFPPLVYGSFTLGIALSGSALYSGGALFFSPLLVFIGLYAFLLALRVSNDVNDLAKDRIAYPDRPFPLGTIKLGEAKQALLLLLLFLFAYSQFLWVVLQGTAALCFIVLACWAWLADRSFFLRSFFVRAPFVQALLTPVYALLMGFFTVSAGHPEKVFGTKAWAFSLGLYGAMLTYQLCRTLSPHLHPIVAAFIHFYGFRKTFYLAFFGLVLSAVAAAALGVGGLLWPVEFIVLGSLVLLFYQPEQFRGAEMAATASLVVHAWSGIF